MYYLNFSTDKILRILYFEFAKTFELGNNYVLRKLRMMKIK
jgi:hypothetical protein